MKKYIKYALFAVFGFVVSSVVFTVGNNNTYKVYNNDSDKIKILKNASNNKEENLKLDKEDVLKLAQIYYKKIYDKLAEGGIEIPNDQDTQEADLASKVPNVSLMIIK